MIPLPAAGCHLAGYLVHGHGERPSPHRGSHHAGVRHVMCHAVHVHESCAYIMKHRVPGLQADVSR
eukprot:scaffold1638_cov549-Prasinococcus_capsulatus_cf.AAC.1